MTKISKRAFLFSFGSILLMTFCRTSAMAGDCLPDCMSVTNCWNIGANPSTPACGIYLANCQQQCRNSNKGASYGAIAYSIENGAYGFSDSWDNREKAEKTALDYCSQHGKGCKSMVWFSNSCGAVASDGEKAAWGQASSVSAAKQQSLDKCEEGFFGFFKKHCEVKVYHCSFS